MLTVQCTSFLINPLLEQIKGLFLWIMEFWDMNQIFGKLLIYPFITLIILCFMQLSFSNLIAEQLFALIANILNLNLGEKIFFKEI